MFRHNAVISPTQIAANTDNWNPTNLATATIIRATSDASRNLTGIQGGAEGRVLYLHNVGAQPIVLLNDATSTAANRFLCPEAANMTLEAGRSVQLIYDGTSQRWRVVESIITASASVIRNGTSTERLVSIGNLYSAAAVVALTDAATIAVDMATFINASVTLGGNRALGNPTNPKVGQSGVIAVTQDATGSRTLTFGSNWKREGGAPTLSTAAGSVDYIVYHVVSASLIIYDFIKAPA
jgi:hypothetical protein